MFEVGKYYELTFGTWENYEYQRVQVLEWAPPLLRYEIAGKTTVLNTSSPVFYQAESAPSPKEIDAAEKAFFARAQELKET